MPKLTYNQIDARLYKCGWRLLPSIYFGGAANIAYEKNGRVLRMMQFLDGTWFIRVYKSNFPHNK